MTSYLVLSLNLEPYKDIIIVLATRTQELPKLCSRSAFLGARRPYTALHCLVHELYGAKGQ